MIFPTGHNTGSDGGLHTWWPRAVVAGWRQRRRLFIRCFQNSLRPRPLGRTARPNCTQRQQSTGSNENMLDAMPQNSGGGRTTVIVHRANIYRRR